MEVDSLNRVGAQTRGGVFLSYASQDADAVQRICAALQAAGIEAWFNRASCEATTRREGKPTFFMVHLVVQV
jgi:TIR domain-containing protein